ncbi:MAG: hypothetical protein JOY64_18490 [Alphaproteobacteria bacterium]|nr:hypothetical protein [Alphaproteobacteria bacterium]
MSQRGRPTLYRPEHPDLARRFCQLGGTNDELADFLEVSPSTIDEWLRVHPEFADAVRKGRDVIDMAVAERLLSRAMGYTHEGRKVVLHEGEEKEIRHVVHYPPDVRACMFWLRNRRRKHWLERAAPDPDDSGLTVLEIEEAAERSRRVSEQYRQQAAERDQEHVHGQ